ncbi:hypothetical protein SERLADRAFT_479339 [Serpula lacrymans var. lacrymans S7.9]|uniref:Uncharacterized protein n=1 Tax=Serpula lacrymans var. lacrymans (strain S7.9) TaxID=578457 RepID=F8PBM5_SERL9|nr:uncharacterized protein SERLADRAFT_479339 [Serpula lacrymans var. lacrymans S7.9]EGO19663.1 hypothetical protein SERLADRAFT_479339 [Serpula lacrymans var. lacrymans S7.9]
MSIALSQRSIKVMDPQVAAQFCSESSSSRYKSSSATLSRLSHFPRLTWAISYVCLAIPCTSVLTKPSCRIFVPMQKGIKAGDISLENTILRSLNL